MQIRIARRRRGKGVESWEMNASAVLLDRAKSAHHLTSDYKLAQVLGWSVSFVSNLRTGQRVLSDEGAEQLADFAGLPLSEVLIALHAEKAKTPASRAAWAEIAERLAA